MYSRPPSILSGTQSNPISPSNTHYTLSPQYSPALSFISWRIRYIHTEPDNLGLVLCPPASCYTWLELVMDKLVLEEVEEREQPAPRLVLPLPWLVLYLAGAGHGQTCPGGGWGEGAASPTSCPPASRKWPPLTAVGWWLATCRSGTYKKEMAFIKGHCHNRSYCSFEMELFVQNYFGSIK